MRYLKILALICCVFFVFVGGGNVLAFNNQEDIDADRFKQDINSLTTTQILELKKLVETRVVTPQPCVCANKITALTGNQNVNSGIIVNCICGSLQCVTTISPLKDFSVENLSCHALKPNRPLIN